MKQSKSLGFLSNFRMSSSPIEDFLATVLHCCLFCFGKNCFC